MADDENPNDGASGVGGTPEGGNQDELANEWEQALNEQGGQEGADPNADWDAALNEQAAASADGSSQPMAMASLEDTASEGQEVGGYDLILDIPVTLSMEVGRTNISIRNILKLNQGSVIELDRMAGEPLDVIVNGALIAHGEVVVINDKFGIRLTDVMSQAERIRKLQ